MRPGLRHTVAGAVAIFLSFPGAGLVCVSAQVQGRGQPIVTPIPQAECAAAARVYGRYSPGLPVLEDAMNRTARLVEDSRRGTAEDTEQLKQRFHAAMAEDARALVPLLADLKLRIGTIDTRKVSGRIRERRRNALEILANLDEVASSLQAGTRYGEGLVYDPPAATPAERLYQEMVRLKALLHDDSGLIDAMAEVGAARVGEALAIKAARRYPTALIAEAMYRAVKLRIDAAYLTGSAVIDHFTAAKAEENLRAMGGEYAEIRNAVVEAQNTIRECDVQEARERGQPQEQPQRTPSPSPPSRTGKIVTVAGIAAGLAAALAFIPKPSPNGCGTCNPGSCLNCFEGQGVQTTCCPGSTPFYCSGTGRCYTDLGAASAAAQRQNTTCLLPARERQCF